MKIPFAPCGVPESERPVTVGPTASEPLPATTKSPSLLKAWAPRPSAAAFPARSAIAPPCRPSAEAPTPIPFESACADCTS